MMLQTAVGWAAAGLILVLIVGTFYSATTSFDTSVMRTRRCHHCGRHSWLVAEGESCPWCGRKTWKYEHQVFHIIALVAIVSMVVTAWRLW